MAPVLALTAICVAVASAPAHASGPALVLEPNCSTSYGEQNYDVSAGVVGFPPGTDFLGDLEFETIEADGSLKPSFGTTGTFTTEADGSFVRAIGMGQPIVATLTVNSDLLPGGSQSRSVRVTCEPEPPIAPRQAAKPRPKLVAQCRRGHYRRYGFKSQRRCVAYVRRGPRAR
ncbi:MAG: hypothetical protein QOE64_1910 [Frankiales bacterium]|nr:hypothetical protein [Frankiales bacterium]